MGDSLQLGDPTLKFLGRDWLIRCVEQVQEIRVALTLEYSETVF